jgi:predicted transcriptional regulator
MNYDAITKKIMDRMKEVLVARKTELIDFVKGNINPEDPKVVVSNILNELAQKGLITPLYASESTFAITQKGMRQ